MKLFSKDWWSQQLHKEHIIELDELQINKKLNAFYNPSGKVYLLFNGNPTNSTLKNYICKIGNVDKKDNKVNFDTQPHTINEFKLFLDYLHIPYEIIKGDDISIDLSLFQFKKCGYSIYDEDVKEWYNKVSINELEINNPRITAEKVEQYYWDNIFKNDIVFGGSSNGWHEYRQICQPYCKKYDLGGWVGRGNFKKLSQPDLTKLYNEMRQLVKKHVGEEVLNELEINNPRQITAEKVEQYYKNNIYNNNIEFDGSSNGWHEYKQIGKPYLKKYNIIGWIGLSDFEKLSQSDLTKFYNEMRKLIQKRVGKEVLNELEINNPRQPIIGKEYDIKVWWTGENWKENKYFQKIYKPCDGTIGGEEGWYWSKNLKCVSVPNSNDIAFEDPISGERFLYNNNDIFRLSILNELQINKPLIFKINFPNNTENNVVNNKEELLLLLNEFIKLNPNLCKHIDADYTLSIEEMIPQINTNFPLTVRLALWDFISESLFHKIHFKHRYEIDLKYIEFKNFITKQFDKGIINLDEIGEEFNIDFQKLNELEINKPQPNLERAKWNELYNNLLPIIEDNKFNSWDDVENAFQEVLEQIHKEEGTDINDYINIWDDKQFYKAHNRFEFIYKCDYADLHSFFTGLKLYKHKNDLNELQISNPLNKIKINKLKHNKFINNTNELKKNINEFININLQLSKRIGQLESQLYYYFINEITDLLPMHTDKICFLLLKEWLFCNIPNYFMENQSHIYKWWFDSYIDINGLENLGDKLNELEINNPRQITVEKVRQYLIDNIIENGIEFDASSNGWKEYRQICKPYYEKYGIAGWVGSGNFEDLSQQDLTKLYNEMRQLVKKHVGKEILNELEIEKKEIPIIPFKLKEFNHLKNLIKKVFSNRLIPTKLGDKVYGTENEYFQYGSLYPDYISFFCKIENFSDSDKILLEKIAKRFTKGHNFRGGIKIINNNNNVVNISIYHHYITAGNSRLKENKENKENNLNLFKEFIKICCNELNIKEGDCKIKLSKNKSSTSTFAHFNPNKPEIVVYIKNRNILDSMRSLAHELKHYQQFINGELNNNSGEDGSKHENEANSFAGIVLRKFGRNHPELYTHLIENKQLNELQINKPFKTWNLDKIGIEFGNIKVNDVLIFTIPGWDKVAQKVIEIDKITERIKTQDLDEDGNIKPDTLDWWYKHDIETWYHNSDLNELEINNPLVTAEKAEQYYKNNIHNNNIERVVVRVLWGGYKQICEPYCKKYDLGRWVGRGDFKYLSQPDLIRFYNEMRQLVKKHVGKEILNEGIFGNYLFGDEKSGAKFYGGHKETDINKETNLFKQLKKYVSGYKKEYSEIDLSNLITLFIKLRKEYPEIVDPKLNKESYIYRGTYITQEQLNNYSKNKNPIEYNQGYIINDIIYKSRRKVQSWSVDYYNAATFAASKHKEGIPVIIRVKVKNADLFWNPHFINLINGYKEDEVLNIKLPLKADLMVINLDKFEDEETFELSKYINIPNE